MARKQAPPYTLDLHPLCGAKTCTIPAPVTGAALEKYFLKHVRPATLKDYTKATINDCVFYPPRGFYIVRKEIRAFKLAMAYAFEPDDETIVNLTIPKGAVVCADPAAFKTKPGLQWRKMRASRVLVHSISFRKDGLARHKAHSHYDRSFEYAVGDTIEVSTFSWREERCAEGIHFFLNLADAYNYAWN